MTILEATKVAIMDATKVAISAIAVIVIPRRIFHNIGYNAQGSVQ